MAFTDVAIESQLTLHFYQIWSNFMNETTESNLYLLIVGRASLLIKLCIEYVRIALTERRNKQTNSHFDRRSFVCAINFRFTNLKIFERATETKRKRENFTKYGNLLETHWIKMKHYNRYALCVLCGDCGKVLIHFNLKPNNNYVIYKFNN